MVREIMQDELEALFQEKKIVIIDYSATWCNPCRTLGKLLEQKVVPQIESDPDVALVKIDIDKNREFAQAMQVKGVPAIMFFHNGNLFKFEDEKGPTDRIVGFRHNVHLNILEIVKHLKLQQKMVAPTTTVINDDDKDLKLSGFSKQPSQDPGIIKNIKIIREYEFVRGQIRFKIGLINNTGEILTDIGISFSIPNTLMWITHEPNYQRKGDVILIPKLGIGVKESVSVYLEPINSMRSPINATITFFDSKHHPQAVAMSPKMITISCPIFFTEEEANLGRVKHLIHELKYTDRKILPVSDPAKLELIYGIVLNAIGAQDIKLIDNRFSMDDRKGEAWFYGRTKVKQNQMVIYFNFDGDLRKIDLQISGNDLRAITGLLAKLEFRIRTMLINEKILRENDPFYDISTSVALGHCPFCLNEVPKDTIRKIGEAEIFICPSCNSEFSRTALSH